MKDNHKATKFFVDFYQISTLLDYNKQAIHQRAYLSFPKRIKDELIHFDKPQNLDSFQALIQKIDQHHREPQSKLFWEMSALLNPDQKSNKTSKLNPNSDWNGKPTLSPSASESGFTDKDKDKSKSSGNPNMDVTDKLTPQEHQQCFDNELCLLCGKSGHIVCDCPKSIKARAAKASDFKSSETKDKFPANFSEANN